jgi:hypothetical protein
VDGAATGSGRLFGVVTDNVVQNVASEFLKSNFGTGAGSWGAYNLSAVQNVDIVYTPGITKKIFVKARVTVPLLFLRMFGFPNVLVASVGQATRTDSRVMFVLDRSGSMNTPDGSGSTVIADALANAATFIGKFREGVDELGLVVFDGSGVVGYPTFAAGGYVSAICSAATCGPNTTFQDGTANDMLHQVAAVAAGGGTGMADALSLAYIELQKAHMRDLLDPLNSGVDTRTSTIVLLTDGVPTAISLYLNNPTLVGGIAAYNVVNGSASGNACNNKTIAVNNQVAANMMLGFLGIAGPAFSGNSAFGLYQPATMDTAHSSSWWMSNAPVVGSGGYQVGGDFTSPATAPYAGCPTSGGVVTLLGSHGAATTIFPYFTKIPDIDKWGTSLTGANYVNSSVSSGPNIYNGTALNMAQPTNGYNWGLAMWNSVDNVAASIRLDSNKLGRGDAGPAMKIGFEVLGYSGTTGVDSGLLKRVANDPNAVGFVAAQPNGRYYEAADPVQLAAAMNAIAADILRLSR